MQESELTYDLQCRKFDNPWCRILSVELPYDITVGPFYQQGNKYFWVVDITCYKISLIFAKCVIVKHRPAFAKSVITPIFTQLDFNCKHIVVDILASLSLQVVAKISLCVLLDCYFLEKCFICPYYRAWNRNFSKLIARESIFEKKLKNPTQWKRLI